MIDRRGFLSLLGLSGVGLAVERVIPSVLIPAPLAVSGGGTIIGNTLVTPSWIMKEIAAAFKEQLGGYRTKYVPCERGARIGDVVEGHMMTDQWYRGSEWDWVEAPELVPTADQTLQGLRDSHCRPIGRILAEAVKAKNIRVLSDLSLPAGGANVTRISSKDQGFSIRGVWQYHIMTDRTLFSAELIGAA